MPLEEAAGLRGQGGFVWLGLFEPDTEELARLREAFGLHELAIEDTQILHRRPKVVRFVLLAWEPLPGSRLSESNR